MRRRSSEKILFPQQFLPPSGGQLFEPSNKHCAEQPSPFVALRSSHSSASATPIGTRRSFKSPSPQIAVSAVTLDPRFKQLAEHHAGISVASGIDPATPPSIVATSVEDAADNSGSRSLVVQAFQSISAPCNVCPTTEHSSGVPCAVAVYS